MKFSIIIPFFQAKKHIKQALDSCLRQTYSNFEVILVDDGSTDNYLETVAEYIKDPRIVLLIKKDNTGTFLARKSGIEVASGDKILFLDSDDILIENSLEYFSRLPDKDIIMFQYLKKSHLNKERCLFSELEGGENTYLI